MKPSVALFLITATVAANAQTPKLKIETRHGTPAELQKMQQIERLAAEYNLKRFTTTRRIVIDQGARPHSSPVLTLNARCLGRDDLTLSTYIHEQAHWLLMTRYPRQNVNLYDDLKRMLPSLPVDYPKGSGDARSTYLHLAVILLEWQGMEQVLGIERARQTMDFLKTDHYTAIYTTVLERRALVDNILGRYGIGW
jgi:hypothetical protein